MGLFDSFPQAETPICLCCESTIQMAFGRIKMEKPSLTAGMPHASVKSKTFYTHISSTMPEPYRAKHLMIWCGQRATDAALQPIDNKKSSKGKGKDETPRTAEGDQLLKQIMDDFLANLGKGIVQTNVLSSGVGLSPRLIGETTPETDSLISSPLVLLWHYSHIQRT